MQIRLAKDVRANCKGDVSCPEPGCVLRFAPTGRNKPVLVDESGRPYCTHHAEERSVQFKSAVKAYKLGLRERALLRGLELGEDASPSDRFRLDFPSSAVATLGTTQGLSVLSRLWAWLHKRIARLTSPWVRAGAALRMLLRAKSADAARESAYEARAALEDAGVPAFNAKVIDEKLEQLVKAKTQEERQRLCEDVIEAIADSARRIDMAADKLNKSLAFGFGTVFCAVLAYGALRQGATIDERQFWLLRVVAAVAAAGVAAVIPGFITVNMKAGTRFAIRAGGALAVFLIIYRINPPDLISPSPSSASTPATLPSATTAP